MAATIPPAQFLVETAALTSAAVRASLRRDVR
jgi:hypothetical protein